MVIPAIKRYIPILNNYIFEISAVILCTYSVSSVFICVEKCNTILKQHKHKKNILLVNIDVMKTSQLKGVSLMASELFLSPLRVREERKETIRKPLVSE